MKSRDFCYWLQGYFEIHGNRPVCEPESTYHLNESQIQMIKNHLAMVFKHEIDPSNGSLEHNKELSDIHKDGIKKSDTGSAIDTLGRFDFTTTLFNC
jgi:hypothetical protein